MYIFRKIMRKHNFALLIYLIAIFAQRKQKCNYQIDKIWLKWSWFDIIKLFTFCKLSCKICDRYIEIANLTRSINKCEMSNWQIDYIIRIKNLSNHNHATINCCLTK